MIMVDPYTWCLPSCLIWKTVVATCMSYVVIMRLMSFPCRSYRWLLLIWICSIICITNSLVLESPLCRINGLVSRIHSGRPFGGVGCLWRRALAKQVTVLASSDETHRLVIAVTFDNKSVIKIMNVYFPYFCRLAVRCRLWKLSFVEGVIHPSD
jgi:hypothetical protein